MLRCSEISGAQAPKGLDGTWDDRSTVLPARPVMPAIPGLLMTRTQKAWAILLVPLATLLVVVAMMMVAATLQGPPRFGDARAGLCSDAEAAARSGDPGF